MPCRDGVRRVFADQADIASTKREAAWGVRQFAQRVSCILLRTACEADFLAHGWQRRMKHFLGGGGTTFTKSRNSWPGTRWPAIYKQQSSLFACSTSLPAQFHAVSTWYSHSHDQPKQCHDAALKVNSSAKDHERNAKLSLQQQNNRLL